MPNTRKAAEDLRGVMGGTHMNFNFPDNGSKRDLKRATPDGKVLKLGGEFSI